SHPTRSPTSPGSGSSGTRTRWPRAAVSASHSTPAHSRRSTARWRPRGRAFAPATTVATASTPRSRRTEWPKRSSRSATTRRPRAGCSSRSRPRRDCRSRRSSARAISSSRRSAPSMRAPESPSGRQLALAHEDGLALRRQLCLEAMQLLETVSHEGQLRVDVRQRGVEQTQPLRVRVALAELPAYRDTRLFRFDELLQLVERDVEEVAQPHELAEPLDVAVVVGAVLALAPCLGLG